MKELQFPYVKYLITPESGKSPQYVYRPVVPVELSLPHRTPIVFEGLIDSGADECTFPAWILKALGGDLHRGQKRIFSGIGGSVLAYRHKTSLVLSGVHLLADVYYSHRWDDMPFGLLGQAGFFSRFDVRFLYREKAILLSG